MGTDPCVDIYEIFRFELVHCLSLGVGIMLQKWVVLILGDESRTTSPIRCANGKEKSFRAIKRTVLLTLNTFLKCCAENSPENGLRLDFSNLAAHGDSLGCSMGTEFTVGWKPPTSIWLTTYPFFGRAWWQSLWSRRVCGDYFRVYQVRGHGKLFV